MGKWSSLKGKLPALPGESPEWVDKVRAAKRNLVEDLVLLPASLNPGATIANFTLLYNKARDEKDALAEREKALNIRIEALQQLILEKLEESGSDIWRGNGHAFSEKIELYASTSDKSAVIEHFIPINAIAEELQALSAHVDDPRLDKALEMLERAKYETAHVQIPWQTLNSLVKAEAEAGELVIEEVGEGDEKRTEVTCSIPGVKVFLKNTINRRKAGEKS